MLIHRIAAQLYTAEAPQVIEAALDAGKDATLAVSQSGRVLMLAAQFARRPRPVVYIVSGEEAADRAARALAAYVGLEHVARFPERTDYPWQDKQPDDASWRLDALRSVASRGARRASWLLPRALFCAASRQAKPVLGLDHVCRGRGTTVRRCAACACGHGVHRIRRG